MFVLICKRNMRNALVFFGGGGATKKRGNPVAGRCVEEPQKNRGNPCD